MIGRTLGNYQVLEALGAGGMGEVFKARDTRLNRFVAIKVLRGDLVANTDRRQRFVQEAQAASALNHPNIVTIHDVFQHEGVDCLVMEYVAGKTLDAVIPRTGMRLNEALRVAVLVAEGLRKAHAAGIIHRDIKPSNIMVGDDGPVKVLDFGLAKLTEAAGTSENDATLTQRPETEEGTVMGTVAYMSPEQAEGLKVDARTDVFSFGALLYEMVTGRRAFGGSSKLSTMSAILKEEPKPVEGVPADLEKIIRRCLRKDREKRYQHMDDLKLALEEVREESALGKAVVVGKPAGRRWVWVAVVVLSLGMIVGGLWWFRSKPIERVPAQLRRMTFDAGLTKNPAISPDGKLVAYASDRATNGANLDIWVQHAASQEPVRLTKDDGNEAEPHFSPDGGYVAYSSSRGGIWVVPVLGGEPRQISKRGSRPRYSPDGKWIAYHTKVVSAPDSSSVFVVPATGGAARQLGAKALWAQFPVWAPDGAHVWTVGRETLQSGTDFLLMPLDGGAPKPMELKNATRGTKSPVIGIEPSFWLSEWLVVTVRYEGRSQILRMGVDPSTGTVTGKVEAITAGTASDEDAAGTADGRMVFASRQFRSDLWMLPVDANQGKVTGPLSRLTEDAALNDTALVSEDGATVAFLSNRDGQRAAWVLGVDTGKLKKVSPPDAVISTGPVIPGMTRDGKKLTIQSISRTGFNLFLADLADGTFVEYPFQGWSLSPTGKYILRYSESTATPLMAMRADTREAHEFMVGNTGPQRSPVLSPDEQWIALHTVPTAATRQVFILPFHFGRPATEQEWIPITDGNGLDRNPAWSPDGKMLYWLKDRDGSRGIWAIRLDGATKRPVGEAFPVQTFPGARRSMMNFQNTAAIQPAVARDKIVFALGEDTGNIWMTQIQ